MRTPKNIFIKFTSLTIQMGVSVYLAAYFGKKIDAHFETSKPYFAALLCLLSIFLNIYYLVKQLKK